MKPEDAHIKGMTQSFQRHFSFPPIHINFIMATSIEFYYIQRVEEHWVCRRFGDYDMGYRSFKIGLLSYTSLKIGLGHVDEASLLAFGSLYLDSKEMQNESPINSYRSH
jgi:hypothetical protein